MRTSRSSGSRPRSTQWVLGRSRKLASRRAAAVPAPVALPLPDKRGGAAGSAPRPLASERRRLRCLLDPRKQRGAHFPNAIVSGTASARLQSHETTRRCVTDGVMHSRHPSGRFRRNGADDRYAGEVRSGPARAEAEATSAMRRGTCASLGPWRATFVRACSASARGGRGLHVSEDRAFGA